MFRIAKRLLIVGWDAADWNMIDLLFSRGEMPHLHRLVESGIRADLVTLEPKLSPLLWTSIATGKTADKHGILNFAEPDPSGDGLRIIASTSRKTKALWNILTQSDLRANAVGWYASHPAEPINGVCVSNLFQAGAPASKEAYWSLLPGAVHPAAFADDIAKSRVHPGFVGLDTLISLLPRLGEIDANDHRVKTITRHLAQCLSVHNAATAIMAADSKWDCTMVFYDTIDAVGHHFMQYHPPRMQHVSERDFELYGDVMKRLYRFHDRMLGELLERAGPETTVMLLSDHGFYSDHLRPVRSEMSAEQRAAVEASWHRPMGVLAMSGPGFRRARIHGASLLDITPTSLVLLGLPVGADMDGRVLAEAFDRPVQIDSLFSWDMQKGDAGMHPEDMRQDTYETRDALKQLVDLGYMADLPEGSEAKLDLTRRETRFNLAVVYMTTGRPDRAVAVYEELVRERADEPRYVLCLARCLMMCGRLDGCTEVLRRFLSRSPANAEARILLTACLAMADRTQEAAAECEQIERDVGQRPELAITLGDLCSALRRWDEADRHYRRALEHDSNNPAIHLGLTRAALGRERFEDAVDHSLRAVELQHVLPEGHHLLGVALTWIKDYDHAIQSFNVALSMQPGYLDAHRYLASIYRHLGQRENAAKHRVQAEKLISAKATGMINAEFLKREAPMGPQEWARRMGVPNDPGAQTLGQRTA